MIRKLLILTAVIVIAAFLNPCEFIFCSKDNRPKTKLCSRKSSLDLILSRCDIYPLLHITKSSGEYFNKGTYAVKITKNCFDKSIIKFRLITQNQSNSSDAYIYAYKKDEKNHQVYYCVKLSPGDSISPIPDLSITDNQSIVYIFKVISPGYYTFRYPTI